MRIAPLFTSALLLVVLPARQGGDRPTSDRPDRDPPSRVGRLSYVSGSVSFRPGDVDDWTNATINYPLHNGDHLWTDSDARAEITVGSSAFRLAPQSAFGFLALDDRTVQVRLSQGSLNVRVRDLAESESLEIDTPSGAVTLLRSGVYRVDVDSTGDTTSVTVRRGEAEVTASGSAFPVHPEQTAMVVGGDSPTYDVRDAIRSDDWEDWCASRDRRWDDARSSRYVSRDVIGYEDLDDNGEWRTTPDYGPVWVPRTVATGWAPYRYGHWAWVEPWGWTWIDDAPWGFAPFHYGRWVYVGDGWAWVPGRVVARPVYAPALVVFVGGRNWSVATGARESHDPGSDRAAATRRGAGPVRGARAGPRGPPRPPPRQRDDPNTAHEHAERERAPLRACRYSGATRANARSGVAPGARRARRRAARAAPAVRPSRHARPHSRPRPDARTPGRTAGSGPAREPAGSRQAAGGATVCIDALKTRRPADPLPRLSAGAPEGRAAATAAGAAASGRAAGQGTEGRAGHDEVEKAVVDYRRPWRPSGGTSTRHRPPARRRRRSRPSGCCGCSRNPSAIRGSPSTWIWCARCASTVAPWNAAPPRSPRDAPLRRNGRRRGCCAPSRAST